MKQLLLPMSYNQEEIITLSKEDSHYILKVQRKGIGFTFDLLDSGGCSYSGSIINIEDNNCIIRLFKKNLESQAQNKIYLFQCIPKGKKIDLMIRQSVEIGVDRFYPILGDHSVPSYENKSEMDKKRDRWQKIVKEATQQSGSRELTEIQPIMTLKEALLSLGESTHTGIFFHQVPLENQPLHKTLNSAKDVIIAVIGPEGGLSQNEVSILHENGFTASLLGDNILRAETATTFALGAIKMILLEKKIWKI